MLRKILILHINRRHVLRLIHKHKSNEESIRLTSLLTTCEKSGIQDSGEIINMFNDGLSINIPRSSDIRGQIITSDIVNVSLNKRATLDLSSNMQANTPDLPMEAVNVNDRPYDSIMSLGACANKNTKYISRERIDVQNTNEDQHPLELDHDNTIISLYLSNESRFGVKGVDEFCSRVVRGDIDIIAALEAQRCEMVAVETFWRNNGGVGDVGIFVSLLSGNTTDVEAIVAVFRSLGGMDEDVTHFVNGLVPLSYLLMNVDEAVRVVVDRWRLSQSSDSSQS